MLNSNMLKYRESQITSATPEDTVLMLYDGAIRFLRSAISEIEEKNNIPAKAIFIEKVIKILDYLQSCINEEKGGVISENLHKLYDYMQIKLTEANFHNDISKMNEVLKLLLEIREGWKGVCNQNNAAAGLENPSVNTQQPVNAEDVNPDESRPAGTVGIKA